MKTKLMLLAALLLLPSSGLRADEDLPLTRGAEYAAPGAAPPGATQAIAHVVTVLVPALDDGAARAMVIRRATHPGNLILVTTETTPREYLNALRALNRSRRELGEEPVDELRASIPAASGRRVPDERALAGAAAHLSRVRTAPQRAIEGLGSYPALTTALPVLQR